MIRSISLFLLLLLLAHVCAAQVLTADVRDFSRADSLRGGLRPERAYNVYFYDLSIDFDLESRSIKGRNQVHIKAESDLDVIQLDLFENMSVDAVRMNGEELNFSREYNAFFVQLARTLRSGSEAVISVDYSGKPKAAARAPWDGGFVWSKDENDKEWVAVACQGMGASAWWPCKDHLSDEPDSMRFSLTVPAAYKAIANGDLRDTRSAGPGKTTYEWFVTYPINSYNVTFYIGDYIHFSDVYYSEVKEDSLRLDYYVLPYNREKADSHFTQVKPCLAAFEHYFGPYPFWNDGFALVEAPYAGMEHQSAIAYGNRYQTGYWGTDYSRIGLDFDYIIIHETGHEWWGNMISVKDNADLWIHEGFCTWSEAMYVEYLYSYDKAMDYIAAIRSRVDNEEAVIGNYGVNDEGSGDMYPKGSLFINTLRHVVDDDSLFFGAIREMVAERFAYRTTDTREVREFLESRLGVNLLPLFEQYLRIPEIPVLHHSLRKQRKKEYQLVMHWEAAADDFEMPVEFSLPDGSRQRVNVGKDPSLFLIRKRKKDRLRFDQEKFYFELAESGKRP